MQVSVTDPPSPNNDFGPFVSTSGASVPLVTLNTLESDDTTPIANVVIRVYNSTNEFVSEGTTDASGVLSLPLSGAPSPGTTYIVRPILANTNFVTPQSIAVVDPITPPSLNSFNITGTPRSLPIAVNPSYCRISGYLTDVTGAPLANNLVRIEPIQEYSTIGFSHHFTSSPSVMNSSILLRGRVLESDSTGFIDFELPRRGKFKIHLGGASNPIEIMESVIVPDLAGASISDVLFPYVASVSFAPTSLSINLTGGSTKGTVLITALDQLGRQINSSILSDLLEFTSSDVSIVSAEVNTTKGELNLGAAAVGTSTISATRKSSTSAVRVPAETTLTATLVVTVV